MRQSPFAGVSLDMSLLLPLHHFLVHHFLVLLACQGQSGPPKTRPNQKSKLLLLAGPSLQAETRTMDTTIPTGQAYSIVALVGALIGFATGCFF